MREKKVVFKRYVQNQPTMRPARLQELVPKAGELQRRRGV